MTTRILNPFLVIFLGVMVISISALAQTESDTELDVAPTTVTSEETTPETLVSRNSTGFTIGTTVSGWKSMGGDEAVLCFAGPPI